MVTNIVEQYLIDNNIKYITLGSSFVVHCFNPDHEDINPSMRIDKLEGFYHCFSCGWSGILPINPSLRTNTLNKTILKLKTRIQDLFIHNTYISGSIPFNIEYRDISINTYKHFGAFTNSSIKELKDRVCFPIKDLSGKVVVYNARLLYSNIDPRYTFYPSHITPPFFPQNPDILDKSIILVEGLFDMLKLYDNGLTNTVCIFGTKTTKPNKFNENKKILLENLSVYKLQGVEKLYLLMDGDDPGKKSALTIEEMTQDDYIVERIDLPENTDPGELTKNDILKLKKLLYG